MSVRKRVVIVSYFFPPGRAIGGKRPAAFFANLLRTGFDCHVITASSEAASTSERIHLVPDRTAEVWTGSTKSRYKPRAILELILRRLLLRGQIGLTWCLGAARLASNLIAQQPPGASVLIATAPPMSAAVAGLLAKRRSKAPWILDVRDPLWLDPTLGSGFRSHRATLRLIQDRVLKEADVVIANTQGIANVLKTVHPNLADKVHTIPNGYESESRPVARERVSDERRRLVHVGELYSGRNANVIIESLLRLTRSDRLTPFELYLVGGISARAGVSERIHREAVEEGWLHLHGPVPRETATSIQEEADGLLLLQPQSAIQIPAKLYDYICIGRPILALAPKGSDTEALMALSGIEFVCVYPDDKPDIVDEKLLRYFALPPNASAPSPVFLEEFNYARLSDELATIVDSL